MSVARRESLTYALDREDLVANPGLVLHRYLSEPVSSKKHPEDRRKVQELARKSLRRLLPLYEPAFARRKQWLKDLAEAGNRAYVGTTQARGPLVHEFQRTTPAGGRLIVGLGGESPLETGLALHHTYGVPIIPGSAQKGLAAHYCNQVFGEIDGSLKRAYVVRKQDEEGHAATECGPHRTLFGDTDDEGFITFLDAWIDPTSLKREDEGLLFDVMTPHHRDYYGGKQYECEDRSSPLHGTPIPPTDFDGPMPVQFLSARGTFHFTLCCADATPAGGKWLEWAAGLLQAALANWGVGGKTSSGYGRLVEGQ